MENYELIRYEYKEICGILPEVFIGIVLKGSDDEKPSEYKKVYIFRNSPDWLWNSFFRFIMPFQMKTNRDGKRKHSLVANVYSMVIIIVLSFLIITDLFKYLLIPVWAYVIIRTLLPMITAFIRLKTNKTHYVRCYREDRI